MIVTSLKAWPAQSMAYHPVIRQALAFLAEQDFKDFTLGKIDLILTDSFACYRRWIACLLPRLVRNRTVSLSIFST